MEPIVEENLNYDEEIVNNFIPINEEIEGITDEIDPIEIEPISDTLNENNSNDILIYGVIGAIVILLVIVAVIFGKKRKA